MTVPAVASPGPRAPAAAVPAPPAAPAAPAAPPAAPAAPPAAPAAPPPVLTVWRREARGGGSGRKGSGWPCPATTRSGMRTA